MHKRRTAFDDDTAASSNGNTVKDREAQARQAREKARSRIQNTFIIAAKQTTHLRKQWGGIPKRIPQTMRWLIIVFRDVGESGTRTMLWSL